MKYYANGKLLLTAEYFVLDGAWALALPTKYGQSLSVKETPSGQHDVYWKSWDADQTIWFEARYQGTDYIKGTDNQVGNKLSEILQYCKQSNPDFLAHQSSIEVSTQLSFPRNWGLGTSSTLIYNLAKWANIDPYQLQFQAFGGSGYDIACAGASGAILYQKLANQPHVNVVAFDPPYKKQLYFVYLGKKQNSRAGIARYRQKVGTQPSLITTMTKLTEAFLEVTALTEFDHLIDKHENLVAQTLALPKSKDLYFSDFWGAIKSLGAWGGDFILATSNKDELTTKQYFKSKGFDTILTYEEMIKEAS